MAHCSSLGSSTGCAATLSTVISIVALRGAAPAEGKSRKDKYFVRLAFSYVMHQGLARYSSMFVPRVFSELGGAQQSFLHSIYQSSHILHLAASKLTAILFVRAATDSGTVASVAP